MSPALKILVVEDEVLIAMMLEDMLVDMGHDVAASVHTLEKAQRAIEADSFQLAILDVNLGSHSSLPLARELHGRGIPFIVATGEHKACLRSDYFGAAIVTKPFDEAALQNAIRTAMA